MTSDLANEATIAQNFHTLLAFFIQTFSRRCSTRAQGSEKNTPSFLQKEHFRANLAPAEVFQPLARQGHGQLAHSVSGNSNWFVSS